MLKTSRTKPRRKGKPSPRIKPKRVEDPEHLARVRAMPCIACQIDGEGQTTPTEAHHIRRETHRTCYGARQKAPDTEVIPLCKSHHWNGSWCQSAGWSLAVFEAKYGNERDLLARTIEAMEGVDTGS